mmetsp:Transcript_18786/g.51656  ORF Transcript_18786/g.51656 Transcript_18786/m.51656 type:complete len:211 (+) Transcript_18786:43-675(+)
MCLRASHGARRRIRGPTSKSQRTLSEQCRSVATRRMRWSSSSIGAIGYASNSLDVCAGTSGCSAALSTFTMTTGSQRYSAFIPRSHGLSCAVQEAPPPFSPKAFTSASSSSTMRHCFTSSRIASDSDRLVPRSPLSSRSISWALCGGYATWPQFGRRRSPTAGGGRRQRRWTSWPGASRATSLRSSTASFPRSTGAHWRATCGRHSRVTR